MNTREGNGGYHALLVFQIRARDVLAQTELILSLSPKLLFRMFTLLGNSCIEFPNPSHLSNSAQNRLLWEASLFPGKM